MLDKRTPYTFRIKDLGTTDIVMLAQIDDQDRLCFTTIERGHMLTGRVKKDSKRKFVFESDTVGTVTLSPLTFNEFNDLVRPSIGEYLRKHLNDLDDVYSWYRHLAGIA